VAPGSRLGLMAFRIGLPAVIAAAGIVLLVLGGGLRTGLGAALLGIALMVALVDVAARLSISSQDDRDREQAARRYFQRTGRWPGQQR